MGRLSDEQWDRIGSWAVDLMLIGSALTVLEMVARLSFSIVFLLSGKNLANDIIDPFGVFLNYSLALAVVGVCLAFYCTFRQEGGDND